MLILASSSPRRIELLKKLVPDFKIIAPDIPEQEIFSYDETLPRDLAKLKAYKVFAFNPLDTIIACDTMVYVDGQKLGKPADEKEAFNMLKTLSGRSHKVLTGLTILNPDFEVSKTVVSEVIFNNLSEELIREYIATGSPFDKAGAYGVQDHQFNLVKKVVGSLDNVMGFPTEEVKKIFRQYRLFNHE